MGLYWSYTLLLKLLMFPSTAQVSSVSPLQSRHALLVHWNVTLPLILKLNLLA